MQYLLSGELTELGTQVLKEFHPGLEPLSIMYLFRPEAVVTDGKVVAGCVVRIDDRNWSMHQIDAFVEIAKDVWDEASPDFRRALMDHELSHIEIKRTGDGEVVRDRKSNRILYSLKRHDIEEFTGVLKRHGDYHEALRQFLEAFAQRKTEARKVGQKPEVTAETF
jgi:hypothetical protein